MLNRIPDRKLKEKIDEIDNMTIEEIEHAHRAFSDSSSQSPFKRTMMAAYETAAKDLGYDLSTVHSKATYSNKRGPKGY